MTLSNFIQLIKQLPASIKIGFSVLNGIRKNPLDTFNLVTSRSFIESKTPAQLAFVRALIEKASQSDGHAPWYFALSMYNGILNNGVEMAKWFSRGFVVYSIDSLKGLENQKPVMFNNELSRISTVLVAIKKADPKAVKKYMEEAFEFEVATRKNRTHQNWIKGCSMAWDELCSDLEHVAKIEKNKDLILKNFKKIFNP